jgi:acetyl-CoA acyltransferase
MPDALIVDAVRSPIGKKNGTLASIRGDELAAQVLNALLARHDVDPGEVEDVQLGCVTQIGEQGWNIGRMVPMVAGWPETVAGTTVDRQCGSSMQTNFNAAAAIWSGQLDLVVSAGVEMMSRVPMGSNGGDLSDKLLERWQIVPQGLSAEAIAEEWKLSREELDAFSLESHRRAISAIDEGRFENEIVPVEVQNPHVGTLFTVDETPRRETSAEALAGLNPAFLPEGKITAGNSSQICDGAAGVLVTSERKASELGLEPRARFVSFGLWGVDPYRMLHAGVREGAREGGSLLGRHLGDRGQRSLRVGRAPVRPRRRAPGPDGRRESERRRHLARPPAGGDRCADHGDADQRARAARGSLRHRLDVHRLRPGDRGRDRAALTRWLLIRGRGDRPLGARVSQDEIRRHSSSKRPSVQKGDRAVLYAAVWQAIFGIVEVTGDPENDPERERWAWRFRIRPLTVVGDLYDAPPVEAAGIFPQSLWRHSHIRLSEEQFAEASKLIEEAV